MPFNIVVPDLLTTEKCNLRCKYCFEDKGKKSLSYKKFEEYVKHKCYLGFFMFGGEPLMNLEVAIKIIENTPPERRNDLRNIITNGTLIKKHLDTIKKYNLKMQISVDGDRDVNNLNRVYVDGSGTFDKIMEAIQICIDEKIEWSIHGVADKQTIPFLAESLEWFFDQFLKKGLEKAMDAMGHNVIQIIFEEDFDDKDVDILLEQFYKVEEWIFKRKELTREKRKELLIKIFNHKGGMCGSGTGLMALDTDLNVYPCHRLATVPEREEYTLGNVYKPQEFKNFKVYNSYWRFKNKSRYMYSSVMNNDAYKNKETTRWVNWCPATNWQTSRSIYYQNCKYNLMHVELNNVMRQILKYHGITGRSNKCSGHNCDNKQNQQ